MTNTPEQTEARRVAVYQARMEGMTAAAQERERKRVATAEGRRHRIEGMQRWMPEGWTAVDLKGLARARATVPFGDVGVDSNVNVLTALVRNALVGSEHAVTFEHLLARLESESAAVALEAKRYEGLYDALLKTIDLFSIADEENKQRIEELEAGLQRAHAELESLRSESATAQA